MSRAGAAGVEHRLVRAATTRLPAIRIPRTGIRGLPWMPVASFALALWSTIELGPVSGFFPLLLLLVCTALYLGILRGVAAVEDARARLARARPVDPRAERWLRVARWAALVAGALVGAHVLTAGGPLLSSAFAIGCLVGGAVAALASTLAELAVRAVAAPRPDA